MSRTSKASKAQSTKRITKELQIKYLHLTQVSFILIKPPKQNTHMHIYHRSLQCDKAGIIPGT